MSATSQPPARPLDPATVRVLAALRLTPDDLYANRQGQISATQHQRHAPQAVSTMVQLVLIGHLAFIMAAFGLIALVSGQAIMWVLLLVIGGIATVPFTALSSGGTPIMKQDIARGTVESTCGMVVLDADTDRQPAVYRVSIGELTLTVDKRAYDAFRNGADYCLYYLPGSKTLLSAEALV